MLDNEALCNSRDRESYVCERLCSSEPRQAIL
jgi:hypothetical protein